jgi:hypothetical protein
MLLPGLLLRSRLRTRTKSQGADRPCGTAAQFLPSLLLQIVDFVSNVVPSHTVTCRMVTLRLDGFAPRITVGPAPFFMLRGPHIRRGPDNTTIALYAGDVWLVGAGRYTRIDCSGPVCLHFVDEQGERDEAHGPFREVSIVDGMVMADDSYVAKFLADKNAWHVFPGGEQLVGITLKKPITATDCGDA